MRSKTDLVRRIERTWRGFVGRKNGDLVEGPRERWEAKRRNIMISPATLVIEHKLAAVEHGPEDVFQCGRLIFCLANRRKQLIQFRFGGAT